MNVKLSAPLSAVSVRGFIPPAVFTELQSLGFWPRRGYPHLRARTTRRPPTSFMSAGHVPILTRYAEYLKRSGVAGFKAIASVEDQAVFEAIRNLSG